jgi:hypothetical protein
MDEGKPCGGGSQSLYSPQQWATVRAHTAECQCHHGRPADLVSKDRWHFSEGEGGTTRLRQHLMKSREQPVPPGVVLMMTD